MWLIANALAMIALPLVALLAIRGARAPRWRLFALGAASFVGSQCVHLPLLLLWPALTRWGALPAFGPSANAIVLGLLAAACEEPARLVVARFATRERGRDAALALGAGHGGIEALIRGALALLGAIGVIATRGASTAELVAQGVAPEAAASVARDVALALAMPWYQAIGGALEGGLTIPFQIACSLLVMAAVRRGRAWPFALALAAHATVEAAVGLLVELDHHGWVLALELAALYAPFTVLAFVWARRAEPTHQDVGKPANSTL